MKQLLDFLPIIIFFIGYKISGVVFATKALIITTLIVLVFTWIKYRKIEKMTLVTSIMVFIFGALTIYFNDERFIVWKVTLINGLFMSALLFIPIFIKQTLLERMLGDQLTLPKPVWQKLNTIWATFFAISAAISFYLGTSISFDIFMIFKTFVFPGLSFALTIGCGIYIYKYLPKEEKQTKSPHFPE